MHLDCRTFIVHMKYKMEELLILVGLCALGFLLYEPKTYYEGDPESHYDTFYKTYSEYENAGFVLTQDNRRFIRDLQIDVSSDKVMFIYNDLVEFTWPRNSGDDITQVTANVYESHRDTDGYVIRSLVRTSTSDKQTELLNKIVRSMTPLQKGTGEYRKDFYQQADASRAVDDRKPGEEYLPQIEFLDS